MITSITEINVYKRIQLLLRFFYKNNRHLNITIWSLGFSDFCDFKLVFSFHSCGTMLFLFPLQYTNTNRKAQEL